MKRTTYLFIFLLAFIACFNGHAQEVKLSGSRKAVRTPGDVLACLTPAASLATVLILQDWQGLKQGALAGVSTVGMTYALKYLIKKERPDGSDNHSFPSMHTLLRLSHVVNDLEMGYSGICRSYLCRLEPYVCQEARLVGRGSRSRYGYRQCLYLYPSVRPKA